MDVGDLLPARKVLNDALLAGGFSAAKTSAAKRLLNEINQAIVLSPRRFADDEFGGTYSVKSGERLTQIAASHDVTWQLLGRLNGLSDPKKLRAGATLKVIQGPFHAVVYKKDFLLELYLGSPGEKGSMYITSFPVGLGKDDSTPTGVWMVEPHKKLPNPTYFSPRGGGVIDADDPKNPLGEYWIGLSGIDGHAVGKSSYGIHGTIEPGHHRQAGLPGLHPHAERGRRPRVRDAGRGQEHGDGERVRANLSRLFSNQQPNPRIDTLLKVSDALDYELLANH